MSGTRSEPHAKAAAHQAAGRPAILVPNHALPALPALPFTSLDVYKSLGWANIERHTNVIREWLYAQLSQLRHSNGAPMLRILGRCGELCCGGWSGLPARNCSLAVVCSR